MLFSERKRMAAIADAEARGESFWTEDLSPTVRTKIANAWKIAMPRAVDAQNSFDTHISLVITMGVGINNPDNQPRVISEGGLPPGRHLLIY
jgi:hypothetical protein